MHIRKLNKSFETSVENFTCIPNCEQTAITHWSLPETIRASGLFPMNVFNNFGRFKSSDTSMTKKQLSFIELSKSQSFFVNSVTVYGTISLPKFFSGH